MKTLKKFSKFLASLWLLIYLWPNKHKPFAFFADAKDKPYNIAHRGGPALAPEETLAAFSKALQVGADMFEYDVHMTKDGHLIASHDPSVDRVTTGTGLINEMTLAEIKQLDAGDKFVDLDGNRPYQGQGITLATVEEIFQAFPKQRAVIELKDTNDPVLYEAMVQEMWRIVQKHRMEDKVIVASFDHAINRRFKKISHGRVAIGAGESEATHYIVKMVLRLNALAKTDSQALQLPLKQKGINLTQRQIVKGARRQGLDIYYWTVNDPATMRALIRKGVDGIMSDNPALLQQIMNEELGRY